MFKLITIIIATALYSSTLFSEESAQLPTAEVINIKGVANFEGKPLKQGDKIVNSGKLVTLEKSILQIKIAKWNNTITLAP